jgi:hypothetical protein
MQLSESRFRNQIADIKKRKTVASTPLSSSIGSTITTRSRRLRNLGDNNTLETTTTITRPTSDSQDSDEDTIGGGTAEKEDVVTIITTETAPETLRNPTWHNVGWKELALAGFLSSVSVLGFTCYFSDVCTYC